MEQKSNVMGTVALACGIGLIVLFFVGFCLGFIPFLNMFGLLLYPIDWVLALVGVVTGIVGYSNSKTMDGVGAPQSLAGAGISGAWILFQVVIFGLVMLLMGGAVAMSVLGAILGQH